MLRFWGVKIVGNYSNLKWACNNFNFIFLVFKENSVRILLCIFILHKQNICFRGIFIERSVTLGSLHF